jgi:hypothetical protein
MAASDRRAASMRLLVASLAAVVVCCVPPNALAADGYPEWVLAIRDCADDGKLDGTYSQHALQKAIGQLPAFEDEYYGCTETLRHALEGGSGKQGPSAPNGIVTESGAVAAAPEDVAALQSVQAAADAGDPVPAAVRIDAGVAGGDAGAPYLLGVPTRAAGVYPLWVTRDALLATMAALFATLCLHALRRRRAR